MNGMLTAAAIRCKLSMIRLYRIKAALDFKCRLNKVSQDYHTNNNRFEIRDAMRSNSFVHYYTINIIIVCSWPSEIKSGVLRRRSNLL